MNLIDIHSVFYEVDDADSTGGGGEVKLEGDYKFTTVCLLSAYRKPSQGVRAIVIFGGQECIETRYKHSSEVKK